MMQCAVGQCVGCTSSSCLRLFRRIKPAKCLASAANDYLAKILASANLLMYLCPDAFLLVVEFLVMQQFLIFSRN